MKKLVFVLQRLPLIWLLAVYVWLAVRVARMLVHMANGLFAARLVYEGNLTKQAAVCVLDSVERSALLGRDINRSVGEAMASRGHGPDAFS